MALHPVAAREANAWGLYDMGGNAWEWIWDHPGAYGGDALDPAGPHTGAFHVLRGRSALLPATFARSAQRGWLPADTPDTTVGLRIVRAAPDP